MSRFLAAGLDEEEFRSTLGDAAEQAGLSREEIEPVLDRACHSNLVGSGSVPAPGAAHHRTPPPASPTPDEAREAVEKSLLFMGWLRSGRTAADVSAVSPIPMPAPEEETALVIEHLYLPGEQINIVLRSKRNAKGKLVPDGKGVTHVQEYYLLCLPNSPIRPDPPEAGAWLRTNPVDGRGISNPNVTAYRYLLLESDSLLIEHQLALFANMPNVAMIVSSGGRSLHCWLRLDAESADEFQENARAILSALAPYGIDQGNDNPSRLSRLPGVMRGDRRQSLIYLDPAPTEQTIAEKLAQLITGAEKNRERAKAAREEARINSRLALDRLQLELDNTAMIRREADRRSQETARKLQEKTAREAIRQVDAKAQEKEQARIKKKIKADLLKLAQMNNRAMDAVNPATLRRKTAQDGKKERERIKRKIKKGKLRLEAANTKLRIEAQLLRKLTKPGVGARPKTAGISDSSAPGG